jgi:aspartyl/asparaginyl beta-hydroxylase (cupin superfamily)
MVAFLLLSGAIIWALFLALVVVKLFQLPAISLRLNGPSTLAYTQTAWHRLAGLFYTALLNLRLLPRDKVSSELLTAMRSIRLKDMQTLSHALQEVDRLPTIRTGLAALGLKTIFEVPARRVHRIASPYTHPLQHPPYYLPGVPARAFYDPAEFEWVRPLEEAFPIIKSELLDLLNRDGVGFKGYVSEYDQRVAGWNTFNFFFFGKKFEENCALCPQTTALLESLPRFEKDHIMFSALNPHARIPPHTGPMNGIIRAHLPLIVPEGCYIRVGDDERTWVEGKVMVFDDSFEHEVWNHSDHVRIVLFMNFWHPCFAAEEIPVLERFRAAYERGPVAMLHAQNQAAKRAHDLELKQTATGVPTS